MYEIIEVVKPSFCVLTHNKEEVNHGKGRETKEICCPQGGKEAEKAGELPSNGAKRELQGKALEEE